MKTDSQPQMPIQPDSLRLISYCPLCNTHYNLLAAKILEERDEAHLIHIQCKKCQSSIVALVLTNGLGVSSVGLVTDLTGEDAQKFVSSPKVSIDDVLMVYTAFQTQGITVTDIRKTI